MHLRLTATSALVLFAVACGPPPAMDDAGGTDAGVPGSDAGPTIRFALPETGLPRPFDVPWPTDLHRDADGTIVDSLTDWSASGVGRAASSFASYGALDGFGVSSGAVFLVDGADVDDAMLPHEPAACAAASSPIAIVDLESGARVPCRAGYTSTFSSLAVWPFDRLAPGHRYAAYVTDAARTTDGSVLQPTATFRAIRDDASRTDATAALYREAIDAVTALGVERAHLVAVTPFTTQTLPPVAGQLRDQLLAEHPAPTLITDDPTYPMLRFGRVDHAGWTATLDAWMGTPAVGTDGDDATGSWGDGEPTGFAHSHLGAILHGAFVSPQFARPYTQTGTPDDGTIALDAAGHATVADATARIPVMFLLPSTPPPAAGWPVVIFQHGNGQHRAWAIAIANELARAGIATVAIDIRYLGMRRDDVADAHSVLSAVGTYDGPDGVPDMVPQTRQFEAVGDFVHTLAARDTFRQTVLDLVQLRRLIDAVDLSPIADEYPGATPRLDAAHVGYVGISLGAMIGTMLASVAPRASIDPFVLDVDAGQLFVGLCDSPAFQDGLALLGTAFGLSRGVISHPASPFCHLTQGLFDAADPGVVAADAAAGPDGMGHAIWLIGAGQDEALPRSASDALMRAIGAVQITPTLRPIDGIGAHASPLVPDASGRLVGYFELAPATHVSLEMRRALSKYEPPWPREGAMRVVRAPSPPLVRQPIVGTQRAIAHFLTTAWAGAPEIAVDGATYPGLTPVADFDDDGACDADETAAGTDPFDSASTPAGTGACVRDVGF